MNDYDEQREQLLHPSSISFELISFLRILPLNMFRVFADDKSGDNFRHNVGPRYLKECLLYVTALFQEQRNPIVIKKKKNKKKLIMNVTCMIVEKVTDIS